MSRHRLIPRAALALILALSAAPAGQARPHHPPHAAPRPAPKAPPAPPPAPLPERHDWRQVVYWPDVFAEYLDLASLQRDGKGGLTYKVLAITYGAGRGSPPPGAEIVHHLSCGLMMDAGVERGRLWPEGGAPAGPIGVHTGGGFLTGGRILTTALNTACAGGDPAAALDTPSLATTEAAYQEGAGLLNGSPPPPVVTGEEQAPYWIDNIGAAYVELPGGVDTPGAALFLEVPRGSVGPGGGQARLRSVVLVGPERMADKSFGGPAAVVRMALYDCGRQTMQVEMQGGYGSSGRFSWAGRDLPPRGPASSPALGVEIAAACAIAAGKPPPGAVIQGGWRAAFDAARARWPQPAPDIALRPPAPPMVVGPPRVGAIQHPDWLRKPTMDDLARYYPERAQRDGVSGAVWISCTVTSAGTLVGCSVVSESPEDYGFGEAALKMSKIYKMRPATSDGIPVEGATVRVPLHFDLPKT